MEILFPPKRLTMYSGRVQTCGSESHHNCTEPVTHLAGNENREEDESEELQENESLQRNVKPVQRKPEFPTLNSNAPTAMPEAAPVPARPMKCSLPILLAKREAPIGSQNMYLPARKYPSTVPRSGLSMD